jgi:hypothetical protein
MSLSSALLLDAPQGEISIVQRFDKQRGTGTVNDPFTGGISLGMPIVIS